MTTSTTSEQTGEGNLAMGLLGGLGAAIIGAVLWAIVTVATEFQIGFMAVGVGFLVGFAVRKFGNGTTLAFGVMGGALALLGCLAGNFLSIVGFIAKGQSIGYLQAFSLIPANEISGLMSESFNVMDLVFYAIAVYEGFKLAVQPKVAA